MYEGCEESCESSLIRDFHFLSPVGRSHPQLTIGSGGTGKGGYQPVRSCSDVQIPCSHQHKKLTLEQLDLDSLSSDSLTDADGQQTSYISTSPQSVDSGLECLLETNSTSSCSSSSRAGRFKRLMRGGYECENSTDSTDSGVFSGRFKKRPTISTDSEDSESDVDHGAGFVSAAEEEGELTPVLEASRAEEFSSQMNDGKKRRLLDPAIQHEKCWEDFVDVRMIDFAHTTFSGHLVDNEVGMGHRGPDNGYLLGLDSLAGILSELRGCCASC